VPGAITEKSDGENHEAELERGDSVECINMVDRNMVFGGVWIISVNFRCRIAAFDDKYGEVVYW